MTAAQMLAFQLEVEAAKATGSYRLLPAAVPGPREVRYNFGISHHRPSRRGRAIAATSEGRYHDSISSGR